MPSGFGATLWQVVAGRVVAGFGGGGMVALVLVLIAGTEYKRPVCSLCSLTTSQIWCLYVRPEHGEATSMYFQPWEDVLVGPLGASLQTQLVGGGTLA